MLRCQSLEAFASHCDRLQTMHFRVIRILGGCPAVLQSLLLGKQLLFTSEN